MLLRKFLITAAAIAVSVTWNGCMKSSDPTTVSGSMQVMLKDAPSHFCDSIDVDLRGIEICIDTALGKDSAIIERQMGWDAWNHSHHFNCDTIFQPANDSDLICFDLPTRIGRYDLLRLKDILIEIASGSLPKGHYRHLKFVLGPDNYVVVGGVRHRLDLLDMDVRNLEVNVDALVNGGTTGLIKLDFNADQSVIMETDGNFKLKPVLTVVN